MAKGRSRKAGKAGDKTAGAPKAPETAKTKLKPGVRKQLRRLEGQLADAARRERKRLRKLERARHRRQLIEATLDGLRGLTPQPRTAKRAGAAKASTASKARAKVVVDTAAAAKAQAKTVAEAKAPPAASAPASKPASKTSGAQTGTPARPRASRATPAGPAAARPRAARPTASRRTTAPKAPPVKPTPSPSNNAQP